MNAPLVCNDASTTLPLNTMQPVRLSVALPHIYDYIIDKNRSMTNFHCDHFKFLFIFLFFSKRNVNYVCLEVWKPFRKVKTILPKMINCNVI